MRTQITCDGVTDGHKIFEVITFRSPLVAVKDELKELFKKRKIPLPYIKYTQVDDNTITAYYRYRESMGAPLEKVKLTFKIENI